MRFLRRHPIGVYLAVTFAVTWGAWLSIALRGDAVSLGLSPIYLIGLVGPLVGAFVATALSEGRRGVYDLVSRMLRVRAGSRWWAIAVGIPVGIALIALIFASVIATFGIGFTRTARDLGVFNGFPLTSPWLLWLMLVVVNGFGEETGWRGFLQPRLQRRWSAFSASLVVGAVWSLWHLPAFAITETYRVMPTMMIPMFFAGIVCGSVFLAWLYNHGHHSILLVAIWHGTYNLFSGSLAGRGVLGIVETAVVMAIAVVLVIREIRETWHEVEGKPAHHILDEDAPAPAA